MPTIFATLIEEFKDRDFVQRWATWHKWNRADKDEGREFEAIERRYKQLYAKTKSGGGDGGSCCKK
jgi:hypothetical protein